MLTIAAGYIVAGAQAFARDDEPTKAIAWSLDYKLDLLGVDHGARAHPARWLDDLDLAVGADLERTIGWRGGSAHLEADLTGGASPNADIGLLQGVDSIEVASHRARLDQAWVEQSFAGGRQSLLVGAYDVSGEFGVLASAADLIQPSFGFAPELAAGGPAGAPSYPSTALAARASMKLSKTSYVRAALIGATPGALGEHGGVDVKFKNGVLAIGEAGRTGRGKVAAGAWAFGDRVRDLRDLTPSGDAVRRRSWGAYVLMDQPVGTHVSAFLRAGLSDGDTQALAGSWQAGVRIGPALGGRENSVLALGLSQARLAPGYRVNQRDAGGDPARAETVFELAYADVFRNRLRLQPDMQYVRRPGGERGASDLVILTLRTELAF